MLSVLLGMLLFEPAVMSLSTQQFEITICRGTPGGSPEKGNVEILSRPQIVTRHNQQALISMGQQVPITTDIQKRGDVEIRTITQTQVGIILKMTPKVQDDGNIYIKGEFSISDALSSTSTSVRTMTFHEILQPGEKRLIPFYKTKDNEPVQPTSGNEVWMTIKVVGPQVNPNIKQAIPEPLVGVRR